MAAQVALDLKGLTDANRTVSPVFLCAENSDFDQLLFVNSSARILQRDTQCPPELFGLRDRRLATESGADHCH